MSESTGRRRGARRTLMVVVGMLLGTASPQAFAQVPTRAPVAGETGQGDETAQTQASQGSRSAQSAAGVGTTPATRTDANDPSDADTTSDATTGDAGTTGATDAAGAPVRQATRPGAVPAAPQAAVAAPAPTAAATAPRPGSALDAALEQNVRAALAANSGPSAAQVSVRVIDGVVHLSGAVPSESARSSVLSAVDGVAGVGTVDDEGLEIRTAEAPTIAGPDG